jgi:hypothetical protein
VAVEVGGGVGDFVGGGSSGLDVLEWDFGGVVFRGVLGLVVGLVVLILGAR